MSITATVTTKEKRANRQRYTPNTTIPNHSHDSDAHFYRIIVGAHDSFGNVSHICYRKDRHCDFVLDTIDFDDDDQLEDSRYIFDLSDFKNLLNYLAQYDDPNLATIAKIGRRKIDRVSLLPII